MKRSIRSLQTTAYHCQRFLKGRASSLAGNHSVTMTVRKKALKNLFTLLVNAVQLLKYKLGSCKSANTCVEQR